MQCGARNPYFREHPQIDQVKWSECLNKIMAWWSATPIEKFADAPLKDFVSPVRPSKNLKIDPDESMDYEALGFERIETPARIRELRKIDDNVVAHAVMQNL